MSSDHWSGKMEPAQKLAGRPKGDVPGGEAEDLWSSKVSSQFEPNRLPVCNKATPTWTNFQCCWKVPGF